MSALTDSLAARHHIPGDRRFYPRLAPQTSIPLSIGDQIAGPILNLSENGILVSGAAAPEINSVHRVSLQLDEASSPIRVFIHTVWSDPTWQKSGLQFLDLAEADRAILRAWSARQLDAPPPAPEPAAHPSGGAPLPAPNTKSAEPFATAAHVSPSPTAQLLPLAPAAVRGQWLSALEHHRRVPLRYFWASFAATLFLGATWAAVEGLLPDKILRAPVAHLRSPRRTTDSAPSTSSANPATAAPAVPAPPSAAPPAQSTSPGNPGIWRERPHAVASDQPVVSSRGSRPPSQPLRNTPVPSHPLRSTTTAQPNQEKTAATPQLSASAPASSNASVVSSAPTGPSSAAADPFPPPLNPRPVTPYPAPTTASTHTDGGLRQPVPTPQPATTPAVVPTAPLPSRAALPLDSSPQILQIPSTTTSTYVQLPGEFVVRSPNLTMHIQRSVWVKPSHWFWHSRKRVDLGELARRVDPQVPRFAPGYGTPEYGSITVLATIAKNGRIRSIRPLYGSAQLLPNVSTAVHNWRYQPTYVDNQPVETLARIEVDFHRPDRYSR